MHFLPRKCAALMAIASLCLLHSCSSEQNSLFRKVDDTGIDFINLITEDDTNNILDYEYLYNGGGIATADFNKDGLQDLYFTAGMTGNKLYLNKGALKFTDVTQKANVAAENKWSTGASVVDINNDGWPDLYVCNSRSFAPEKRKNLLYINKGTGTDGIPVFEEMAAQYGLADTTYSTQAAFFDYDNDGDLDMYLLVAGKMQTGYQPNTYQQKLTDGSSVTNDRLYRNEGIGPDNHPVFKDVTIAAGILIEGFGLGVTITDINQDGWKDIYVSNDYLSNDLLWINKGDGTFTNKASEYFKHTSFSAMGNDVQDLNNDGLPDIITLDMLAKDNYRKKMMSPPGNYFNYNNNAYFGYDFQYVRNTIQLNQGRLPDGRQDSIPAVRFSEISFLSGVAETDWSWTPLVADFDNDGYRDLIVSNGLPKDLSDQDFLHFRNASSSVASKEMIIDAMPVVKIADYSFKNNGDLSFSDMSRQWGFTDASFSNGAVYADLDNDGDLDCITNNINDKASVYRNSLNDNKENNSHWLQVELQGTGSNTMAYGTIIKLYSAGGMQYTEMNPVRGYLGSMGNRVHFGTGEKNIIDSIRIIWPDHGTELLTNIKADQLIKPVYKKGLPAWNFRAGSQTASLFAEINNKEILDFKHEEADYIDFNEFRLLPHKFSQYGPALAVADIDGNGTDDVLTGGSKNAHGILLVQDKQGRFVKRPLLPASEKWQEDQGMLFADFDGDVDQDLYVVSGGIESTGLQDGYSDRLYVNDGRGNFSIVAGAVPLTDISGSAVKGADIDNDGDIDLVRTGRLVSGQYPKPAPTLILRNDSKGGQLKFTDITAEAAPYLKTAGLVADALFTDWNNDGKTDLILCGEWMAPMILLNEGGRFTDVTAASGLANETGWWNSITGADFDNDGDIDYVIGNNGTNSYYQANAGEPVNIYAKDFNNDGVYDAIPSLYLMDSNKVKKEYPAFGRDEMTKQIIQLRRKFQDFRSFASATFADIFTDAELKDALKLSAVNLKTSYIENLGSGKFKISPMPIEAQFAPVFGMVATDVDGDGNIDVVINGNDFGTDLSVGRSDAFNGLVLKGNGKGKFSALSMLQSGICIPGNGKALVQLRTADDKVLLMGSQNNDKVLLFEKKSSSRIMPVSTNDCYVIYHYKDGRRGRMELYKGSSFLGQSASFAELTPLMDFAEVFDYKNEKRIIR